VAAAALAACGQPAETKVTGAWVRLPAVAGRPGAAYFTIEGGSKPTSLLTVSAPFAIRTEMHESMAGHTGMMSMAPVKDVAVPANATVSFAPGGKHVMLFDIAPSLAAGSKAPLTLGFADGRKIGVQAVVVGAGDPEPR
jgi:copper(I)-binding protein